MSRKAKQVEAAVEVVETVVEQVEQPEVVETVETVEVPAVDAEQAETDRLNRVNDIEKQIIAKQEEIKALRAELKKLDGKTKREGPTKMELATEFVKNHPGLARKEYVEKFMSELGLTQAGARTYIQLILKKNK